MISLNKRGTHLETKLLELRHVSRLQLYYPGLLNSVFETSVSNVCGPFLIPCPHLKDVGLDPYR